MTTLAFTRRHLLGLAVAGIAAVHVPAFAQGEFPTRPITLVVGWAAGGSADVLARIIAADMAATLHQPIIVDNRPGAGSNIASKLVAEAKPDGYTIMLATSASHGFNSALFSRLPYKPIEDFSPIGQINTSPGTLLVPVDSPFKSLQDIVDAAKAQPGKLNYGSGGSGSSQHLAGAQFNKLANVNIAHIPFKGSGPMLIDLMAGRVDFTITTGPVPYVRSGKLRALAVAAHERHPAMPDVPTFEEAGMKLFTDNWYGLVAPAGTPTPVLETLNAALKKTLTKPEMQKQFIDQGAFPGKPTSPDAFWAFVKKQMPEAAELVRLSGAKVD
ncbi:MULTISPECIES: Bug family tripartite tricarboxylate transporter substrate binding protein [Achromobacter]|uniref:Tripartite tricarboxylate transporter substrate binding protein n=1 Tax=Achromobacter spanius TaxID=217203 RepID=A0ABY8GVZ9_9BURK|nr:MULTISPECIES: tripartite tricarboxylate transporter substrate binding protein [Achromobacter]WAI82056.1 tripartite tricarboxylate transporter substrate binding protein [Achromobacter spanius]WEX92144.1 tripartite tricarboxylate transporter substrate binding protein [Achromobacter sp. SS2-2022]WFP08709.1 tripartite tricarboxylate transporter substrate binding protein [Achromobacter spanius]